MPSKIKVIAVRQPWAWLIVNGHKPVENRTWKTAYRGPLYIHATIKPDPELDGICQDVEDELGIKMPWEYESGGIIGRVSLVDCVDAHESVFFTGPYGFVLKDAEPLPYQPIKGRLGLFTVDNPYK